MNGDVLEELMVEPHLQRDGGFVLVWGCITPHGFGQLACIPGTVKAADYMEINWDFFSLLWTTMNFLDPPLSFNKTMAPHTECS